MKIYKVNINGDFKVKREIDMNNYILWECLGSSGLTLKHKKNGKKLFLATKEFFDHWKESYIIAVKNIGKSYHYIYDENRKTIKDEKEIVLILNIRSQLITKLVNKKKQLIKTLQR